MSGTERARLPFRSVNRRGRPDHDPGLQRHHLLPRQLLSRRCFGRLFDALDCERIGFDDFRANGLLLPASGEAAVRLALPLHRPEVGKSVGRARDAGAAGINMEDRLPGESALVPLAHQAERLAAAAATGLFVNARCDVFRGRDAAAEGEALVEQVLERAQAYAEAGASGLFVPFLADGRCIAAICERSPLPVNVLWSKACGDRAALGRLGVARISHGHQPWAAAMALLAREARAVFAGGTPAYAD